MKSETVKRLEKSIPEDVKIFTDWYADLIVRINQLMAENKLNKKELAQNLEKSPSEISKWLNGEHNFTLKSLAKLSAELGEPLLEVTKSATPPTFIQNGFIVREHRFVSYQKIEPSLQTKKWQRATKIETTEKISNAG